MSRKAIFNFLKVIIENPYTIIGSLDMYDQEIKELRKFKPNFKAIKRDIICNNPYPKLQSNFYHLLLKLVNTLDSITRYEIIYKYIKDPFISIIMKYDYYFKGQVLKDTAIKSGEVVGITQSKIIYKTKDTLEIYDNKSLELIESISNKHFFNIYLYDTLILNDNLLFKNYEILDIETHQRWIGPDNISNYNIIPLQEKFIFWSDRIEILNIKDEKSEFSLETHTQCNFERMVLLEDNRIAVYFYNTDLQIWNLDTKLRESSFKTRSHIKQIIQLDQRRLITLSHNLMDIWDIKTGDNLFTFEAEYTRFCIVLNKRIYLLTSNEIVGFTSDYKLIYTYSINIEEYCLLLPSNEILFFTQQNELRIFNPETFEIRKIFLSTNKEGPIFILPTGGKVLTVNDESMKIWI